MTYYYQKRDYLDEVATAIGVGVILAPILAGIVIAQNLQKKSAYTLEAQFETFAPGTVIGDCEYVTFTEGRPKQLSSDGKLLPPPNQILPTVGKK